jgi:hypothetical protein
MHPKAQHTLFECVSLRELLNAPLVPQDGKRKDQEVEMAASLPSVQKLTLREILSVEPTIQKPLRYSEVPVSFSRDDKWTSVSEPGKFPLILDPIMAGSQLT